MKTTLADTFRKARSRAVPLIAIETADPAQTIRACIAALNGKADATPVATWDIIKGLTGSNPAGVAFCEANQFDAISTGNPSECLEKLSRMTPAKALIFFSNAHRFTTSEAVSQGIWNLRDIYAAIGATLVLLAPGLRLPAELARDVVILSEPLPDREQLATALDSILADAALPSIEGDDRARALDTMTGLSDFEAKQAVALSLTKSGLDRAELWTRKVKQIEATPGLTVYKPREKFSDVAGLGNAKDILGKTVSGKLNISCIVFFDELDKSMSASTSDSSGSTQYQNKSMLCYMNDNDVAGVLFLGPPGTGKTLIAKALAAEYGVPLIMVDLGAMKGGLVGDTERMTADAMRVIHAISDGRALFIGACNRTENLPPELRRRFNFCSMFFDLPDDSERAAALEVKSTKFKLTDDQRNWTAPAGWTGAEIENACRKAWAMDTTLADAAKTIVPISRTSAEMVDSLRRNASGKYISASAPGVYTNQPQPAAAATSRSLAL